jgi:hypothetical protein
MAAEKNRSVGSHAVITPPRFSSGFTFFGFTVYVHFALRVEARIKTIFKAAPVNSTVTTNFVVTTNMVIITNYVVLLMRL